MYIKASIKISTAQCAQSVDVIQYRYLLFDLYNTVPLVNYEFFSKILNNCVYYVEVCSHGDSAKPVLSTEIPLRQMVLLYPGNISDFIMFQM